MGNEKEQIMDKITAHYSLKLWVECPHCKHYFDVLETDEWASGGFEAVEETCASQEGVDLVLRCPKCISEFTVNNVCY
jgi:hypothetical protein